MGSLNFNNFKNDNYSQKKYTYTDIFLDLAQEPFDIIIGKRVTKGKSKDMKVAYDLNAIRNSLSNLFNTLPGERLLLPDYGCNLRKFIFDPVSDSTARLIGRTIKRAIEQWEPRISLVNINIDAYVDIGEYDVTITLEVPFLERGKTLNIKGILNQQGFTMV